MSANDQGLPPAYTKKDFESGVDPRWCPGCGDYGIINQVQRVLPTLGVPRENIVFVSGIGCSSRFPYYMRTYGMHTVHGRAPTFATGLKLSRPELQVWVVTGDGDALAIGGNHFIHAMRRNVDIKLLLFNNRIYGLTKGQVSPTSELGKKTKTPPHGSPDNPFNPLALALGAGATFVARSIDADGPHLGAVLKAAAEHKGTAFVEILQNCPVFNDGAHALLTDKATKADTQLRLESGSPLLFGKDGRKGIRLDPRSAALEVVTAGEAGADGVGVLIHDARRQDPAFAFMLAGMDAMPGFPTPIGIFRDARQPTVEELAWELIGKARAEKGEMGVRELLAAGDTWTVR